MQQGVDKMSPSLRDIFSRLHGNDAGIAKRLVVASIIYANNSGIANDAGNDDDGLWGKHD